MRGDMVLPLGAACQVVHTKFCLLRSHNKYTEEKKLCCFNFVCFCVVYGRSSTAETNVERASHTLLPLAEFLAPTPARIRRW
jgi:hypothetical protein